MLQQHVRECRLKSSGTLRKLRSETNLPISTLCRDMERVDLKSEGREIRPFSRPKIEVIV